MMGDDEISKELAKRDRYRRKLTLLKTPAERMADMARLQESAMALLRANPAGYAHFLRRNHKARAVSYREPNG